MTKSVTSRDVALAVGVGVAVAGLAGLAVAGIGVAAVGTGMMAFAKASRRSKKGLKPAGVQRDGEGRLQSWPAVLKAVQRGGMAPELRTEIWPLLLDVYSPDSTEDERLATLAQLRKLYIKLILVCQELEKEVETPKQASMSIGAAGSTPSSSSSGLAAEDPLPANLVAFAEAHRIIVMDAIRTDFARQTGNECGASAGGDSGSADDFGTPTVTILPVAMVDGMPEIVFVEHAPAGSADAAEAAPLLPTTPGTNGSTPVWVSKLAEEAVAAVTHVSEPCKTQMLRLINLLTAYAIHDPETNYCQGMSDLAAVFIQMFDDDAVAFACFERLMRQARRNFKHDETGIKQQLRQIAAILEHTDPSLHRQLCQLGAQDCMFAYRMVIVMLRRELSAEQAMALWEIQWAHEAAAVLGTQGLPFRDESGAALPHCQGNASAGEDAEYEQLGSCSAGSSTVVAESVPGAALPRPSSTSSFQRKSSGSSVRALQGTVAGCKSCGRWGQQEGEGWEEDGNFQHWFIASVVCSQRWRLMNDCHDMDDVLRLFNGVKIDFWLTLEHAEGRFRRYAQGRAAMRWL